MDWSSLNPFADRGAKIDQIKLPNYQQNRDRLTGYMDQQGRGPYVGDNPYQGGWNSLIQQLQGAGGSLAQAQYQRAQQDNQAAVGGLARANNRPGAFRAAMAQQAKIGQGLAAGSSEAMLQEQMQNRQQLGSALQGAGQAQWQRDSANQNAFMDLMARQLGLDMDQFQAILAREKMRQEKANAPTGLERALNTASQIGGFVGGSGMGKNSTQTMADRYKYSY